MNIHIINEIRRLEKQAKRAELYIEGDNDFYIKYSLHYYQAAGQVAEKLGKDVLALALLPFGIFDIVKGKDDKSADIILLCNNEKDAANFNQRFRDPLTKILRDVTKDDSTLSYFGYPDDNDDDQDSSKTARSRHLSKRMLGRRGSLSRA